MSSLTGENIIFVNILDVIDDGQIQVEGESPPDCVLTNNEFGILTWLPVGDLPQPPQPEPGAGYDAGRNISQELLDTGIIATLDDVEFAGVEIDGDYPYGLSVPTSGIECSGALGVKTGLLNMVGLGGGVPKFQIDGVSGAENQIITFDANDGLKFGSVGGDGLLTAGDNIDPAQLLTGVIAVEMTPSFRDVYISGSGIALNIPLGGIVCNGVLGMSINTIDFYDIIDVRTGDLVKAHLEINGVKGTNNQIIVSNADGDIRWDTVDNIYTPPTPPDPPDPDGFVVNFIETNVRPVNPQGILEWERILDCRLINTLKNGSTANHQRIVSPIDLRNNMPDVGSGHSAVYDPFMFWYFRYPRGVEEIVHFDFSFLVDVKKSQIFIPQLSTASSFWALQVGFKGGTPYSLNMSIILHSTQSPDLTFTTTNKAFRLFWRNKTGTTDGRFPNDTFVYGALPCNLNLDIKLHYKADSNVVDMYLEGWTDEVLGTANDYLTSGGITGTRVFYDGMSNIYYP